MIVGSTVQELNMKSNRKKTGQRCPSLHLRSGYNFALRYFGVELQFRRLHICFIVLKLFTGVQTEILWDFLPVPLEGRIYVTQWSRSPLSQKEDLFHVVNRRSCRLYIDHAPCEESWSIAGEQKSDMTLKQNTWGLREPKNRRPMQNIKSKRCYTTSIYIVLECCCLAF